MKLYIEMIELTTMLSECYSNKHKNIQDTTLEEMHNILSINKIKTNNVLINLYCMYNEHFTRNCTCPQRVRWTWRRTGTSAIIQKVMTREEGKCEEDEEEMEEVWWMW